ncbi:hypothetical protein [Aquimarina celericrescens]|uniref:Uncharacterized protein n=1 Tax=Aquimarina celericrescens TaxID=1964542 RepID=A0ABW5AU54_9FLAO|nr:hypothetical protein [Aquimarina celericrescens]
MKRFISILKKWLLLVIVTTVMLCCTGKNPGSRDAPKWQPIGQTIHLYSKENRSDLKEMNIGNNGEKIVITDYSQKLDTTLLPKKIITFELRDTIWYPFGNKTKDSIYFANAQTYSTNSDATRIVAGNLAHDQQQIQTFDLKSEYWTLVNDTMIARKPDTTGWLHNLKLSAEGKTLAISSPVLVNSNAEVQVYSWKNEGWVPKGNPITIKNKIAINDRGANFYWNNVSINNNGSIITVANVYNYDNGPDAGQVKVFKYIDTTWQQLGDDINGDLPYQNLGTHVSIGKDDTSLFISSSNRFQKYQYLWYTLENNQWIKQENDVSLTFFENPLIKVSNDGTILLISSDYEEYSEDTYSINIYGRTETNWEIIGRIDENRDHFNEFILSNDQTRLFILFDGIRDKYIRVFNKP